MSSNSTIVGNAKAGTTVSGGVRPGHHHAELAIRSAPQQALPQLTFTAQPWIDAGYTVVTYSSCALAQAFINTITSGSYVVRITPTCALVWGNNSTVNLNGNLAIISDGSITTQNQTNWNSVEARGRCS